MDNPGYTFGKKDEPPLSKGDELPFGNFFRKFRPAHLSETAARAMERAAVEAKKDLGRDAPILTRHVLLGLLEGDGGARSILKILGVEAKHVRKHLFFDDPQREKIGGSFKDMDATLTLRQALEVAEKEAAQRPANASAAVGTLHVLLGLVQVGGHAGRLLESMGVTEEKVMRELGMDLMPTHVEGEIKVGDRLVWRPYDKDSRKKITVVEVQLENVESPWVKVECLGRTRWYDESLLRERCIRDYSPDADDGGAPAVPRPTKYGNSGADPEVYYISAPERIPLVPQQPGSFVPVPVPGSTLEVNRSTVQSLATQLQDATRLYEQEKAMRLAADREITELMHGMESAWGLIANVHGGNWDAEKPWWRRAARRWRDQDWHPALDRNGYPSRIRERSEQPGESGGGRSA